MFDISAQLALLQRLPRTWQPFFAHHGTFTAAQVAAIPAILHGDNIVLCAATASGKTEAALAPLIERYCPAVRQHTGLQLLYLTPTRALANSLQARLAHPLETLGLRLAIRTGDKGSASRHAPDVLITTPESADSLLTSRARLFRNLHAIIIDELHLLDGTPRGDQLRAILRRIQRIRNYAAEHGEASDAAIQYVALSATLAEPSAVGIRYFANPQVVDIPSQRQLQADIVPLSPIGVAELSAYLIHHKRTWRKALLFCNSRAEIETYAAALHATHQFGSVFVHYSNIDAKVRHETEQRFAAAESAICIASSTLELGIDIGTIDLVALIGPPGSWSSFAQRIGRGGRRSNRMLVACFYRTSLEQRLFEVLLEQHMQPEYASDSTAAFHPAVFVQQIFSLIKQSPTAAVRPAELAQVFVEWTSRADLDSIGAELMQRGYLSSGRPGEWRAGPQLNELIDSQASATPGPSIHSTIQGSSAPTIAVRDQQSGRTIAHVAASWFASENLVIDGQPVQVEWSDGNVVFVRPQTNTPDLPATPLYRSARQPLSYALASRLPARFGIAPGVAPLVPYAGGWMLFHFLGEVYGRAALDLLRYTLIAEETEQVGLCVILSEPLRTLPEWQPAQVQRYLADSYRIYETLLGMGQFHQLLPLRTRQRAIAEQFDIPRFLAAIQALRPRQVVEDIGQELLWLLD